MVSKTLIKVLTTQMRVSVCRPNLKERAIHIQKRNIKGSAPKVINQDISLLIVWILRVQSICQSSSRGLIDNTENIQTSNGPRIFCRLTLVVIEVGGNGNYGILDRLVQVKLSILLQSGENHRRNFFGGKALSLAL
mmetsp:Transcript_21551/g.59145  ORF Transcript_21551/g.59145 Transcript_21551/m.59145 type:complete len:136 (-) Transcript_21551:329-736(-)